MKRTRTVSGPLVGNRMVLAGAVLYLLEWVAIVAASVNVPLGASAGLGDLAVGYAHHADGLGWAAGWFSVVLLGRILLMVGLRAALDASGRPQRLMDLAVGAMTVSVVIEIVVYAVTSGAAWAIAHGASVSDIRVVDAVAFQTNQMIYGPLGVSLVCAAVAMWRSGLFARALAALGLVAGVGGILIGLAFDAPATAGVAQALSFANLLFWVWMIWTGVVLWRAPRSTPEPVSGRAGGQGATPVPL